VIYKAPVLGGRIRGAGNFLLKEKALICVGQNVGGGTYA